MTGCTVKYPKTKQVAGCTCICTTSSLGRQHVRELQNSISRLKQQRLRQKRLSVLCFPHLVTNQQVLRATLGLDLWQASGLAVSVCYLHMSFKANSWPPILPWSKPSY